MLTNDQKQKILDMSGKELFLTVHKNLELTVKQRNEIYEFWLDQHGKTQAWWHK